MSILPTMKVEGGSQSRRYERSRGPDMNLLIVKDRPRLAHERPRPKRSGK